MRALCIPAARGRPPCPRRQARIGIFAVFLLALFLTIPVCAADLAGRLDTKSVEEALPEEAEEFMPPISASSVPDLGILEELGKNILKKGLLILRRVCKTAGLMLTVCVLVSLGNSLDIGEKTPEYIALAGVAAIGVSAMTDFDSYLSMGLSSLDSLSQYSHILLPVLTAAAAASGAAVSAAAKYGATALFMDILLTVARRVVVPCVCGFAALSVADAAVGNDVLKSAKKLMKSVCTTVLSAVSLAFTGWLALTGVVSGTADGVAAHMTKTAVSAALPVVGGILADAAGALTAAAGVLRGSVGIFGLVAVLSICLGSFLELGARFLVYKLSSALCACVADKRLSDLVSDLGSCFGMVLALNGAGALMLFLSIFSLIRTVIP